MNKLRFLSAFFVVGLMTTAAYAVDFCPKQVRLNCTLSDGFTVGSKSFVIDTATIRGWHPLHCYFARSDRPEFPKSGLNLQNAVQVCGDTTGGKPREFVPHSVYSPGYVDLTQGLVQGIADFAKGIVR